MFHFNNHVQVLMVCVPSTTHASCQVHPELKSFELSSTVWVMQSSNQGYVDGFRWEGLQTVATFDSLSVQMSLKERSRMESRTSTLVCYLGGIWRQLELLERFYSCFPSVDPSSRIAWVPRLDFGHLPGPGFDPPWKETFGGWVWAHFSKQ